MLPGYQVSVAEVSLLLTQNLFSTILHINVVFLSITLSIDKYFCTHWRCSRIFITTLNSYVVELKNTIYRLTASFYQQPNGVANTAVRDIL